MSDARNALIPAGWYPDPHGLPQQRWWSGTQWTATVAPLQSRGPSLLSSLPGPTLNTTPQTVLTATATDPSRFPSRRQLRAVTADAPAASEQQAAAEARAEEAHRAEEAARFEQHRNEQKRLEQLHLEQYRAEQSKLYEQHRLEQHRLDEKFRLEEARLTSEHLNLGTGHLAPVTPLSATPATQQSAPATGYPDVAYPAAADGSNPAPQFAAFAPQQFAQETVDPPASHTMQPSALSSFAPPASAAPAALPRTVPQLALSTAGSAAGTISPAALSAASMPIVSMPVQTTPAQAAPQPVAGPVSAATSLSATPAHVSPVQGHATSPAATTASMPVKEAEQSIPGWHPAPSSLNPNAKPLFAPQAAKTTTAVESKPATTRIPTVTSSADSSLMGANSPFSGLAPSRVSNPQKTSVAGIEEKPAYQPFGMVSRTTAGTVARPERVDTFAVWIIVFFPALLVATGAIVATQLTEVYTLFMEGGILFIFALLTLVFAVRDQRQLIDSGHLKTASPAWMLLTPLAYLIARTVEVKRQSGRMSGALWAWLAVIAAITIAAVLLPEWVERIAIASSVI